MISSGFTMGSTPRSTFPAKARWLGRRMHLRTASGLGIGIMPALPRQALTMDPRRNRGTKRPSGSKNCITERARLTNTRYRERGTAGLLWWTQALARCGCDPGSLLDLVRSNPDAFDSVGFVFVKGRNRPAVVERARENAAELYTGNEDIQTWSSGDMFTGWMEDVHRWPSSFIEFWMPRNQLSVFGRIMIFRELQTGTIFARRGCWRAIRNNIEIEVPTVTDISRNDAKVAKRMLKKHRNVLFSKPLDLWKALVKLESE